MRNILILLVFIFVFVSCGVEDEETGDTGSAVNDSDNGNSGDSGNTGDTGNTGNSGDSGNTGDSGNSGNTGDTTVDPVCGNGSKESGEACDDGADNGKYDFCKSDCSGPGERCGDEIVQPSEEVCDANRLKCNEIEGMGYVNDAEVLCTGFCDAWIVTDCKCAAGFEKGEGGKCIDIDECVKETDNCAEEGSICTNTEGSFTCVCADNFEGDGLTCAFCDQNDKCGAGCSACEGETLFCMDNKDKTSRCVECYETSQCNTEAGEFCTALNKCSLCPLPLTLATWDKDADGNASDEGWTKEGAWVANNSRMEWGSSTKYNSKYTHNLVYGAETVLTHCANSGISFTISLNDDISWDSESGTDKNQRLYVECSGDGGASWISMTPPTLPDAQTKNSGCTTYYCDGHKTIDRTFAATSQTWTFPAGCLAPKGKVRFRADGSSAWELRNPGWTVDTVEMKEF